MLTALCDYHFKGQLCILLEQHDGDHELRDATDKYRRGGTVEQHAARADKWLDDYLIAVSYLESPAIRMAYEWALGMDSTDVPKSMSDWLLDGLASHKTIAERTDSGPTNG